MTQWVHACVMGRADGQDLKIANQPEGQHKNNAERARFCAGAGLWRAYANPTEGAA